MAGRAAPTFLKRQKEMKRAARALEKRQAKQARRDNRAANRSDDTELEGMVGESTDLDAGTPQSDEEKADDPPAE